MTDKLKALAEKAKKYPFNQHRKSDFHIAASPDVVLALIAEVERLTWMLDVKEKTIAMQQARITEIESQTIERCAVIAWNHYMDTCKKLKVGPAVVGYWCSAETIRSLAPGAASDQEIQFAESARKHGLTLVKTASGYELMKLGTATALAAPKTEAATYSPQKIDDPDAPHPCFN